MFNYLNQDITQTLLELLQLIPAVLLALTFHEVAHGFVAYKLGDMTARDSGRLTLNPVRHIDPVGLICMVFLRFGWAKPVPVSPGNFKKPRLGMALVALAGPLMNIVLSFFGLLIYCIILVHFYTIKFVMALGEFFWLTSVLSAGFAVFNLLPLPPLDGSRIISVLLPRKIAYYFFKYERYLQLIVIGLLFTGVLSTPLTALRNFLLSGMESVVLWIVL